MAGDHVADGKPGGGVEGAVRGCVAPSRNLAWSDRGRVGLVSTTHSELASPNVGRLWCAVS